MRIPAAAAFALLAISGIAGAQASCEPYLPYPSLCLRAVADGWYLVPGVGVQHHDGSLTQAGYLPPLFSQVSPPPLEAGTGGVGMAGGPHAIFLNGNGTYADYAARLRDFGLTRSDIDRLLIGNSSTRLFYSLSSVRSRQPEGEFLTFGGLERRIPVEAWRGRRVAVTLRLHGVSAYVSAWVGRENDKATRTASQVNKALSWKSHTLVLDVPQDATEFLVFAGFTGEGKIWLDSFTVAAADKDAPPTWSEEVDNAPAYGNGSNSGPTPFIPPSPGPILRVEEQSRTPRLSD